MDPVKIKDRIGFFLFETRLPADPGHTPDPGGNAINPACDRAAGIKDALAFIIKKRTPDSCFPQGIGRHLGIIFKCLKRPYQFFKRLVRVTPPLKGRLSFFLVQLIKIAFKENCFNQKKAKHGVAAVSTMGFALHAFGEFLRHILEGLIRRYHQVIVRFE